MAITQSALSRKLSGLVDSRSKQGTMSRGNPVTLKSASANTQPRVNVSGSNKKSTANYNTRYSAPADTPATNYGGTGLRPFVPTTPMPGTATIQPVPAPQPMAFDPIYESTLNGINNQLSMVGSNKELMERQLRQQYEAMRKQLGLDREQGLEQNTIGMADRGLVHSGINVGQQGKINEAFQKGSSELAQSENQSLEGMLRDFVEQSGALEQQKLQAEIERTMREEERALQEEERKASEQARIKAEQDLQDFMREQQEAYDRLLQNSQPQPSATGQLGSATDKRLVQNKDQEGLAGRITDIFNNRGVQIGTQAETEQQRINRIMKEVLGGRTLNDVRQSVNWIAKPPKKTTSTTKDAQGSQQDKKGTGKYTPKPTKKKSKPKKKKFKAKR